MNNQILREDVRQFAERFQLWEPLRGKTLLITGATGLIGSVMTKCLDVLNDYRNLGLKIYAAVRDMEKAKRVFGGEMSCVEFLELNLMDFNADDLPKGINYIVHLASPTNGKYIEEHPIETLNLAYQSTKNLLLGGVIWRVCCMCPRWNITDKY